MKSLTKTVAVAALMTTGVVGTANAVEGWYGRADVGYTIDGNAEFESSTADFDDGLMGSVALGHSAWNNWRIEGEISGRHNNIETDSVYSNGDARAYAGLLNLIYDFNPDGFFQPYLGVGVGAARVNGSGTAGSLHFDDSDTGFAYQGLAGFALALTERLDLDVGYRYFAAPNLEFAGFNGATPATFEADYEHQAVTLGLRWQFAAPAAPPPPPAPPPAPPPPAPVATCPQSDFVVYFEWDRSNLNQAALEVIDSAVSRARECNISSATLVGHTDTSGTPQYNVALSERRASVVRDALVSRGLAASLIATEARGEADLARATADGVREPLNRRTSVTIRFQ